MMDYPKQPGKIPGEEWVSARRLSRATAFIAPALAGLAIFLVVVGVGVGLGGSSAFGEVIALLGMACGFLSPAVALVSLASGLLAWNRDGRGLPGWLPLPLLTLVIVGALLFTRLRNW